MKTSTRMLLGSLCLAAAGFLVNGCSKSDPYAEPAPTTDDPTPLVQTPAPAQAPAPRGVPPPPTEADFDIRQVDALVEQRKYESAVDAMLRAQAAQAGRQTDAQRLAHHNRMRLLQQQVAQAMAAGDPEARKAGRLLQQYNAAQTRAGGR